MIIDESNPDAECLDCGQPYATGRPSIGNLLRWRCSSCGGKLVVQILCNSCGETVQRHTGVVGMYGRLANSDTCEHCGESVGLENGMRGSFGRPGETWAYRGHLTFLSLRTRLAILILIYCSTTAFVGSTAGMMVGGCLVGGLYAGGVSIPEMLLGRSLLPGMAPLDTGSFYALVILIVTAAFTAAGVWYGWRNVDVEVNDGEPQPLTW